MNAVEQLVAKRALEILDTVNAGLPEGPLFDQVERMIGRHLTVGERVHVREMIVAKEWAYDYRDKLTDNVMYAITPAGRLAMVAL